MTRKGARFGFIGWRPWVAGLLLPAFLAAAATADHGRYLPDANPTGNTGFNAYGNTGGGANPTAFDKPVVDGVKNLQAGQIKFDYDTNTRNPNGNTRGGASLSGGYFANPNVTVKDGFQLIWVQTVIATRTGTEAHDSWNLPATNAGEYPDADPQNRTAPGLDATDPLYAPSYPFNTPIVGGPATLGFQDSPSRNFADGNQSWQAELALACVSTTPNIEIDGRAYSEVRVVGSLLWGFNLNGLPAGNPGIGNVGSFGPLGWGPATGSFINTLNGFYDGLGGGGGPDGNGGFLPGVASARYQFANNSNCFQMTVPEPASLMLLMFGAVMLRRLRH